MDQAFAGEYAKIKFSASSSLRYPSQGGMRSWSFEVALGILKLGLRMDRSIFTSREYGQFLQARLDENEVDSPLIRRLKVSELKFRTKNKRT